MAKNTHLIKARKLKKTAKTEFTALTGIKSIPLSGSLDCEVVEQLTCRKIPIQKYAYIAYNNLWGEHPKRLKDIKVTPSCGVDQCVLKKHLKVIDPLKDTPKGLIFD